MTTEQNLEQQTPVRAPDEILPPSAVLDEQSAPELEVADILDRGDYLGSWADLAAFGRAFAEDLGLHDRALGDPALRRYLVIDGAAIARDMLERGEIETVEDGPGVLHVFLGSNMTQGGEDG